MAEFKISDSFCDNINKDDQIVEVDSATFVEVESLSPDKSDNDVFLPTFDEKNVAGLLNDANQDCNILLNIDNQDIGESESSEKEEPVVQMSEEPFNVSLNAKPDRERQRIDAENREQMTKPRIAWPEINVDENSTSLDYNGASEASSQTDSAETANRFTEATKTFQDTNHQVNDRGDDGICAAATGEEINETKHRENDISSFRSAIHSAPSQPESDLTRDADSKGNEICDRQKTPNSAPALQTYANTTIWDNEIIPADTGTKEENTHSELFKATPSNSASADPPVLQALPPKIPSAPSLMELTPRPCEDTTSNQIQARKESRENSIVPDEVDADQDSSGSTSKDSHATNLLSKFTTESEVDKILTEAYQLLPSNGPIKLNKTFIKKYQDEEKFLRQDLKSQYQDLKIIFDTIWEPRKKKIMLEAFKNFQKENSKPTLNLLSQACSIISQISLKCCDVNSQGRQFISRIDDVMKVGGIFGEEKKPIHAIVSYYIASKLYRIQNQGKCSIQGIAKSIESAYRVLKQADKKDKNKYFSFYLLPLLRKMLKFLMETDCSDITQKLKNNAQCSLYIGKCYFKYDEFEESLQFSQKAVELFCVKLNNHPKYKPENFYVFGKCLTQIGKVYCRSGKAREALKNYESAVQAFQKAQDWKTESEKTLTISRVKTELQKLKRMCN